jgi:hypothetical protein
VKRLALILCLLAACTAPKAPQGAADPVAAAEAFSKALQEGDTAAAWALLSTNTQARADALAAKARVSADAGPESGKAMLFQGSLPSGVVAAREVSNDGGAASVSVSLDGGPARLFRAVREGAGWKLELDL